MELIPAQKQQVWKLPAVVNFSCGGIGTGFYLIGLLVALPQDGNWVRALFAAGGNWIELLILSAVLKLLGPVLVGIGFFALTTEAGRPQRGLNLFRHLRRSWMSRETLAAAILFPCAGLDWLFPHPALRALAALAAFGLMLSQGFIVYRARGVTAWNTAWMPLFFSTSGFAAGTGLMLVVLPLLDAPFGQAVRPLVPLPLLAICAGVLNLGVWLVYTGSPDRAFQKATSALRRPNALGLIVGVGHLFPAVLLLLTLYIHPAGAAQSAIVIAAGLALVFGGVRQKFAIVLEAGYLRAIGLPIPRLVTIVEPSA